MIGKAFLGVVGTLLLANALTPKTNRMIDMPKPTTVAMPAMQVRDDYECKQYAKLQEIDLQMLAIPGIDHSSSQAQYDSFERMKRLSGC